MPRPKPETPAIQWPIPPSAKPLWHLTPTAEDTRVVTCPGRPKPLDLVADPFSS